MKVVVIFLVVILSGPALAVNLECTPESVLLSMCVLQKVIIPKGAPINYVNISPNITGMNLQACEMNKLPTSLFSNFTQLRQILIDNIGFKQLLPLDMKNSNLYAFVSINNTIPVLKNGVFKSNKDMSIMWISKNKLSKIGVNAFLGLSKLRTMYLDRNRLKGFPAGAFYHLVSADWINLEFNNLTLIPKDLFSKNVKLGSLTLNNNQISTIEEGAFDSLTSLKLLVISDNFLKTLPSIIGTYGFMATNNYLKKVIVTPLLNWIAVRNSSIEVIVCVPNLPLRILDVPFNLIRNMSCIKTLTNLTTLYLQSNKFSKLTLSAFKSLINLETLDLSDNPIKKLSPQMLSPLISLTSLTVDKLVGYKNVHATLSKLTKLGLSTKTWNCTYLQTVAALVNPAIVLSFNSYGSDGSDFTCPMEAKEINKLT